MPELKSDGKKRGLEVSSANLICRKDFANCMAAFAKPDLKFGCRVSMSEIWDIMASTKADFIKTNKR